MSLISKSTIPPVTPLIISALPLATVVGSVSTTSSFLEHKHLMRLQLVAGQSFGPQDEPLLPSNLIIDRDSAQVLSFQPLVQTLRYQLTRDGGLVKVPQKPSPISLKSLNIDKLVKLARTIHHHYLKPQHISFIFTKNDMFIWNVESFNDPLESLTPSPTKHLTSNLHVISKGTPLSPGIVTGTLQRFSPHRLTQPVSSNVIAYLDQCDIKFLPWLRFAKGLVVGSGSPYADWAIRVREMGLPSIIVNTAKIKISGQIVTLDSSSGILYSGCLNPTPTTPPPKINVTTQNTRPLTATKILATVSDLPLPSALSADGLYLKPSNFVKAPKDIPVVIDSIISQAIPLSGERLVIYEPVLGLETSETKQLLRLESVTTLDNSLFYQVKALLSAQEQSSLTTLALVVPGLRSVAEGSTLKKSLASAGFIRTLRRQLFIAIETPHVLMEIDALAKIGLDGVMVNLDKLTPLVVGVNADSPYGANLLGAEHNSIKTLLEFVIILAQEHKLSVYITGISVSQQFNYLPELVKLGLTGLITSESLIEPLRHRLAFLENRLIQKKLLPYARH